MSAKLSELPWLLTTAIVSVSIPYSLIGIVFFSTSAFNPGLSTPSGCPLKLAPLTTLLVDGSFELESNFPSNLPVLEFYS